VRAPIRYAQSGDVSVAYQVTGEGELDLVLSPGFITHLEMDWEHRAHARFLQRLGSFSRLIRFDKRGTGLSDRHGGIADLETRMDDVRAVMDAVGSERAAIFGYFEGGPMAMLFAATYPERVRALVLFTTYATAVWSPEYPWGWIRTEARDEMIAEVVRAWGTGETVHRFNPGADQELASWWGARERVGGSPGAIRHLIASSAITDVRDVLASIQAPTLVVSRRVEPIIPIDHGRYLADHIPTARLLELGTESAFPWTNPDEYLDDVEEFLTGSRPAAATDRVLATLLFTDLVGSTKQAQRLGDVAWAELLERHHSAVRREFARFGGEEIDTAGDGFFALFDGPARAIRCALAAREATAALGLEVRAGIHTGEVERPSGGAPRGIAVHLAARIAARAGAAEILLSSTTRDLVAGSGLAFVDAGEHELKGIDERRRLYAASG
jgi:class 3 adenylate cyclase